MAYAVPGGGFPPLSMTTDYVSDIGSPEPYLAQIAEAGFTHVHWCHEWNTDRLYTPDDMAQARRWLQKYSLRLLDLHGSAGVRRCWFSRREDDRLAGVELVRNRIEMAAVLGGAVVIMHVSAAAAQAGDEAARWDAVRRSLDELEPFARLRGVRIAVENLANDDFSGIERLLDAHGPDYLGLCYDSGHGNIGGQGLDHLEGTKDRLISVHLHDNLGTRDQHLLPFLGTVDWDRLTRIVAVSSYGGCVSLESNMHEAPGQSPGEFLAQARVAASRLAQMVERARRKPSQKMGPEPPACLSC